MHIANSPIEAYEQQRVAVAREQGFALFCINPEGDTPGFVYTIGMAQHQLPELLCFVPTTGVTGEQVATVVSAVCRRMIQGLQRFDRIQLIRALIARPLQVSEPDVSYTFQYLRGDNFTHALQGYLTRAVRYRQELGTPRGVLLMQHPEVPSFEHIRAQRMFAVS